MSMLEDLANKLARDALAAEARSGNEEIVDEVSKTLGDTSSTMQEAYLTAIRIFRAEARGREVLEEIALALPKD